MDDTLKDTAQLHTLKLPRGTETMHLREAARHYRITRVLEDRFTLWGYGPVETPLVDYVEVYRTLLTERGMRDTYRVIDRQGEVLAVRADTTLFLAKQLGLHLTVEELPVRAWYNDQIVRAEAEDEIAANEYHQAGVELVGASGPDADIEVLAILQDTLAALHLEDSVIHAGSHRIIASLVGDEHMLSLAHEVVHRRRVSDTYGLSRDEQELLRFIGTVSEFEHALQHWSLKKPTRDAAEELTSRVRALPSSPVIRIDTSELGPHDYYTGIAFSAYHRESTAAIVRGGRYDGLLRHFGFDTPSVGFSMYTRKLPASTLSSQVPPSGKAPGKTPVERLARARAAHARGERMHM